MAVTKELGKASAPPATIDTAYINERRKTLSLDYAKAFSNPSDRMSTVIEKAKEVYKYLYE